MKDMHEAEQRVAFVDAVNMGVDECTYFVRVGDRGGRRVADRPGPSVAHAGSSKPV